MHGKLRHPRLLGVRYDKAAREVIKEDAVITHPEKVLFPEDGITKGELAAYYESIAPVMLPHMRGRPVTMERYPGRHRRRRGSGRRTSSKGFPEWLERVEVPKKDGTVHHPLDHRHALAALDRRIRTRITPHVWMSRVPTLDHPDVCVFDLDPSDDDDRRCCARRRWRSATCWTSSVCRAG